jgi:hypothetical protein
MILDTLLIYGVIVGAVELLAWLARRARRRAWERSHPYLRWDDWNKNRR